MSNIDSLSKSLGENRVKRNELLSRHTTLKIGGPADVLFEPHDSGELIKAVRLARSFGIPLTVIGGGSNILVSDLGIRGLVIKNVGGKIKVQNELGVFQPGCYLQNVGHGKVERIVSSMARWVGSKTGSKSIYVETLDYSEDDASDVQVIVESGADLQATMKHTLEIGITGLQWYARIPGTIGGAVINNIHGGGHWFSEIVKNVVILGVDGEVRSYGLSGSKTKFDSLDFYKDGDVILEVRLGLKRGDSKRAKATMRELSRLKEMQPMNSAGSIFRNIGDEEKEIFGYPTNEVGYIVEHILNMSGFSIGGAVISSAHHNFIVNRGRATAKDCWAVRNAVAQKALEVLGLTLEDEVTRLGDFGDE